MKELDEKKANETIQKIMEGPPSGMEDFDDWMDDLAKLAEDAGLSEKGPDFPDELRLRYKDGSEETLVFPKNERKK